MAEGLRDSGIDFVGDVPWGTHFCQFYQTGEDLVDILVPYFKAGLESNEFCMWVTALPVTEIAARQALERAMPDTARYLESGQLEIIPHGDWYLKGGVFDAESVLGGWVDKLGKALAMGYDGLRLTGNTFWLEKSDWHNFTDYERAVDDVIGRYRMVALCTYHVDKCGVSEVADVISNHQFALVKRQSRWEIIESAGRRRTGKERERLIEQLAAERERLTVTLRSIGDGVIAADANGKVVLVNKVAEGLTGWTQEEAIGKPLAEVFHIVDESTLGTVGNPIESVLNAGAVARLVDGTILIARDGTEKSIGDSVAPVRDSGGNIVGAVLVFRDVTERKRAEEQIRKLSQAVEQSPSSVVITDTDGNIEYVNPKFVRLTGYSLEEAIGKNPRILKSGEIPPEGYECLWKTITSGGEWLGEFHNKKKNGELYWELANISPIRNAQGVITHFVAVKEDITARKEADERLRKLNEELARRAAELDVANKELEAFSYSVSHDLRAPLRAIDGFSRALLEDYSDSLDEEGKTYLQYVREGSRRMNQLIDDLLNLSRVTRWEIHREQVDLTDLVRVVAEGLQRTQPERRVEFEIAPGVVVDGDSRLLRVVTENLVGNAWKFTSKHSTARIQFGVTEYQGKRAYFIRDDGAGFDMAYADKLFGAFQRLHPNEEFDGTGIGLATVQRIIHRHGGEIWAEAKLAQGATFYFTLGGR